MSLTRSALFGPLTGSHRDTATGNCPWAEHGGLLYTASVLPSGSPSSRQSRTFSKNRGEKNTFVTKNKMLFHLVTV